MHNSEDYPLFRRSVQILLHHLYDPAVYEQTPLARLFGVDKREDSGPAMRRILVDAIESLKPDKDVPLQSNAWRYYHILFHRYVEQFTQAEVAADLGLSVRQLRRQEKPARNLLTDYLWTHFDVQRKLAEVGKLQMDGQDPIGLPILEATKDQQEELQWSQHSFPFESVEVREIISSVLKTAERLFRTLQVEVNHEIPDHLPRLDVQVVPVRQALLNVLMSTAQLVPWGCLEVQADANARTVVIQVVAAGRDRGEVNFTQENLETIAIARKLVEFSRGHILTTTHAQQQRVEIILPREERITVVAIDDNPDTLQLLQRFTANTRYQIVGIQNPHQAVSQTADSYPHLILLDVMLPGSDGWELLGQFHGHPKLRDIPIVICTVLPQEQLAIAQGATAFIRKPISRHDFLSLLDEQIALLR